MRNDIDLVRTLLETIRDRQDLWPKPVTLAGYDAIVVARHIERLYDDGLIDGSAHRPIAEQVATIHVRDLTSAGHEFLSALESGDVWQRLKTALNPTELGALSFREIASLAKELAVKGIKKKLGLE